MNTNVIGLDIAKNIFHTFTMNSEVKSVKKKLRRKEVLAHFAVQEPSVIGIEACGGSHYWARELIKLGHEVILLNAAYVKAFVIGNKNDFNDAEAIYTAVSRPNKRTVGVKSLEQQDIQMLHRIRQSRVEERTAVVNQIRGFLMEYGLVLEPSINKVRKELPFVLEDAENGLTAMSRELFRALYERLVELDEDVREQDRRMQRLCAKNALSQRLLAVPGIGPITATLLASELGDGKAYASGRDYAASLGIVPRQHSSGGKQVYLGISKRGNRYLRTLLIHGARAVLSTCKNKTDRLSLWLQALIERRGYNKATVALANKNARIVWAMATQDRPYIAAGT
jgi:transposase